MWNQLGVFGSRVVEAVFVSEDSARSKGSGVEGTVGAEELEVRMEGSDVKALIAKRMGIPKSEVDTRLISLHQKGELNGTADRSAAGPSDPDRSSGNGSGKSPTLTKKDLEDFERAEAEARNGTPSQTGTPFKLAFKPAVLNPSVSASPRTPWTPPARRTAPPSTPAPSAERQDDEVEMVHT
jgi:hypothetical protein